MCKVLIIPAIKDAKRKQTERFIKMMAEKMSVSNSDGLGYAAITKEGALFAERWFNNKEMFTYSGTYEADTTLYGKFGAVVKDVKPTSKTVDVAYSNFNGEYKLKDAAAITLHARFATCEKNLANVHPFIKNDTSVIHNGVIRNHEKFNLEQSTCDSESILLSYLKNDISTNSLQAQSLSNMTGELIGYYVAAMFSRDAEGNRILDVINGNNTNLYIAQIKELETYVMSTNDWDITAVCKDLGYTVTESYQMTDDKAMRINPFTGDVVEHNSFRPSSQYEQKSYSNYPESHHNGWKEYDARHNRSSNVQSITGNRKKSKPISEAELKYLGLVPKIEVLSEEEGIRTLGLLNLLVS